MSNLTSAVNLAVSSNVSIGGTLTIANPLTSSSSASFTSVNCSSLNSSGNITQTSGSISSGSGGIIGNGDSIIHGNLSIDSALTSNGIINASQGIISNGLINANQGLTIPLTKSLNILGNIYSNLLTITPTEIGYLDGLTNNIQGQITPLQTKTTDLVHTSSTVNTMSNNLVVTGITTSNGFNLPSGQIFQMFGGIVANNFTVTPFHLGNMAGSTHNIQGQFTATNGYVTTLRDQCTDLTHLGTTNTIANNLVVGGNLTSTGISLNGNLVTNNITVSSVELSHINGLSQNCQGQINTINSNATTTSNNVSTLQTKCTDLTHLGTINTMQNQLVVNDSITSLTSLKAPNFITSNGNTIIGQPGAANGHPFNFRMCNIANASDTTNFGFRYDGSDLYLMNSTSLVGGWSSSVFRWNQTAQIFTQYGQLSVQNLVTCNGGILLPSAQTLYFNGIISANSQLISPTEVGHLKNVSSNIQLQLQGLTDINVYNTPRIDNLRYNNPGAYIITTGVAADDKLQIYYSVPDYSDFYAKSTSSIANSPLPGSFYTTAISCNNADDYYWVMAGYRLQVYDGINYTSTLILDFTNTTTYPVLVKPSSANTGSSCRLYYGATLLT